MKSKKTKLVGVLFSVFSLAATAAFAGTGRVSFGAYTAGQGCSGTGICQTGAGAVTSFDFSQTPKEGGVTNRLTMVVNFEQATASGFKGYLNGGTYVFTGGYTFNHPGDQNTGVPSSFSIPDGYSCDYGPVDGNGRVTLVITTNTSK